MPPAEVHKIKACTAPIRTHTHSITSKRATTKRATTKRATFEATLRCATAVCRSHFYWARSHKDTQLRVSTTARVLTATSRCKVTPNSPQTLSLGHSSALSRCKPMQMWQCEDSVRTVCASGWASNVTLLITAATHAPPPLHTHQKPPAPPPQTPTQMLGKQQQATRTTNTASGCSPSPQHALPTRSIPQHPRNKVATAVDPQQTDRVLAAPRKWL